MFTGDDYGYLSFLKMKTKINFQSRQGGEGDNLYCSPSNILMNSKDMKLIGLKTGNYVLVKSSDLDVIVCRSWKSANVVQGSATLHRIWSDMVENDKSRTVTIITDLNNMRISPCRTCSLFFWSPKSLEIISENFITLLRNTLIDVPIKTNMKINITWRGAAITLKILAVVVESVSEISDNLTFGLVNNDTIFRFDSLIAETVIIPSKSTANNNLLSDMDEEHIIEIPVATPTATSSQPPPEIQSPLTARILPNFGGYSQKVEECMTLIYQGLHSQPVVTVDSNSADSSADAAAARGIYRELDSLASHLFRPPRGLLLFGPPGTGKSCLMRALALKSGYAVEEIKPDIALSLNVGDAIESVTQIFRRSAARSPCIILIDDVHTICRQRSSASTSDYQRQLVSCILTLMDNGESPHTRGRCQVFVLATSSRPDAIDPAMRRPGRLDREVEIGVPTAADRLDILEVLLPLTNISIVDTVSSPPQQSEHSQSSPSSSSRHLGGGAISRRCVQQTASSSHGMVGADLLLVCKESHLAALHRQLQLLAEHPPHLSSGDAILSAVAQLQSHRSKGEGDAVDSLDALSLEMRQLSLAVTSPPPPSSMSSSSYRPRILPPAIPFVTDLDLLQAATTVSPSALREAVVEVPEVHWRDIGGMEELKGRLREVVEWPLVHSQLFEAMGISPPRGVLLYGPPGCSKTLLAKALATESSMNFLAVRGPELLSKWLGESEKAIQTLFRRARGAAPSLIFFDEIDALAGKRGAGSGGVSDRVLAQLLTEMDGGLGSGQVVVIAATNRPDMLDSALLRPGRFDRKIYVPPPDALSRRKILELQLPRYPLAEDLRQVEDGGLVLLGSSLDRLVEVTARFSGAEVVAVCTEGAMLAIDDEACNAVSLKHLMKAAEEVVPQITSAMLAFYENIDKNFSF